MGRKRKVVNAEGITKNEGAQTNEDSGVTDKGVQRREKRRQRNAARLQKMKKTKVDNSGSQMLLDQSVTSVLDTEKTKKKKNKGKKKKFLKLEAQATEMGVPLNSLLTSEEDSMVKRLEGGRFRYLNEQLYTMTGEEAQKLFEDDPTAFDNYHAGYRDQAKKWPLNPVNVIIQSLIKKPKGLVIADLGCGDAKIAEVLGKDHTVHSFDLVSKRPEVIACDMTSVPLDKGTCDVVVFCLSLMGTNINEFLREAHRLLKMGGQLRIAEVTSRFDNVRAFMRGVGQMGFQFVNSKTMQDYFVLFEFKKAGKVEQKRPLGLTLKPCLYKKR